jgi:hypothetical protein
MFLMVQTVYAKLYKVNPFVWGLFALPVGFVRLQDRLELSVQCCFKPSTRLRCKRRLTRQLRLMGLTRIG